jgi:hypothetical protein
MEKQIRLLNQCTYFVSMKSFAFSLTCFFLWLALPVAAQIDAVPIFKGAIKANREKVYSNTVKNSIIKNLSLPLTDSTEENWEDAFYAMEVLNYKQPWTNEKIKMAFDSIGKRSPEFQRSLLEMLYTLQLRSFSKPVLELGRWTNNAKIFAMCGEYLLMCNKKSPGNDEILRRGVHWFIDEKDEKEATIISGLLGSLGYLWKGKDPTFTPKVLFDNSYLKGNVIVYSIQRKNRNYPGIVIVKDTNGTFVTSDSKEKIFSVPQLARSITNLPGYLTNGNTPQGIFRMYGFDVSKSAAIGPTENIQLTMPLETSVQHFLKDSTITDTVWTAELYLRLLPKALKNYYPLSQTYYASVIGRTEIISHGTTVDPGYYKGQTYYPYTPTQGCLCTKEIWADEDGKRIISDQQKLVDAVKKAGGADGYLIVIEIDDQQKPVDINEILPYLKKGSHEL